MSVFVLHQGIQVENQNVVLDSPLTTTRYIDARNMVNFRQNLVILGT